VLSDPFLDKSLSLELVSPSARGLAVTASVITLLIIVPHLFFDCLVQTRSWKNFLKRVWLELSWSAMLSVLWLASGTLVALFSKYTSLPNTPSDGLYCHNCWEALLLNASTWLAWGTTFGYFVALFGCFLASAPQVEKPENMTTDDILQPPGNGDVEVALTPPSTHTQQYPPPSSGIIYQPYLSQPSPTQAHMQQRYSFQSSTQPNRGIDDERPVPLQEGIVS